MIQICEAPAVTLPLVLWLRPLGWRGIHSFIHLLVHPVAHFTHSRSIYATPAARGHVGNANEIL